MNFENTPFEGLKIINNFNVSDIRGSFIKTYNKQIFRSINVEFEIRESFYSVSKKNVIRGMHFQLPPFDHDKLVFVSRGSIIDVVIDLRKASSTFKKFFTIELSSDKINSIFIPKGFAHGFKALMDDTIAHYCVNTEYNASADSGIHYNSFGFDWQVPNPILSPRDSEFQGLNSFCENNPF